MKSVFEFLIILIWTRNIIVLYSRVVVYRITHNADLAYGLEHALFALFVFISLPYIIKRIRFTDILIYMFGAFIFLYFSSLATVQDAVLYLEDNKIVFLLSCLPMILFGSQSLDDKLINKLHLVSILSILANLVCLVLLGGGGMNLSEDNMGLSYYILPHVGLVLFYAMKDLKILDIILFLLGSLLIFSYGTRGPLACIVLLFIGLFFLLYGNKMSFKQYSFLLSITGLGAVLLWVLLPSISTFLNSHGLSTRILDAAVSGTITDSNGRNMISAVVLEEIAKNPDGYGLAYDRSLVDFWGNPITYSHNLFLELWLSFGIIKGSIAGLLFIIIIVYGFISAKTKTEKAFIIVYFCSTGFMKLMVSGSFIEAPAFYFMLGLCIAAIRQKGPSKKEIRHAKKVVSQNIPLYS